MSKNFDETVRLQCEKRQEWIREGLQGVAVCEPSTPRLASSLAGLFPGKNECPGTHCSLIVQKEKRVSVKSVKEIEVKEKVEGRTERESDRRSGRLVGAAETSTEFTEWRRLQKKNLSIQGLLRRVASVPQREQLVNTPEPPLPKGKGKEPSVQSIRS